MANKTINGTGLEALMRKIKSLFFAKQDSVEVTELSIDSAPTEDSTNLVTSGGVYDAIEAAKSAVPVASVIPTGGMLPDVMYALGTITTDPNVTISNPSDGKDHEWMLTFSTGSTAPASVTFPSNVQFPDTATFEANKHYEVSMKWDANDSKYYGLIQIW